MKGEVVYMYAYDVAHEIDLQKARESLTQAQFLKVQPDKTIPRDFPFYEPLALERESRKVKSSVGEITVRREVKIFSVGAISVSLRVAFEVRGLGELIRYHAPKLDDGHTMDDAADDLCEEILPSLETASVRMRAEKSDPEAYTVFCLVEGVPRKEGNTAIQWLDEWRGEVAGLLTEEEAFDRLSDSEIQETTRYNYSYYTDDLVVIDWDSALIFDPGGKYEDLLYVLEIANMQLTEFQVYDQMVEKFLDEAYEHVESYARAFLRGPGPMLGTLKAVLMDLSKISEEITNTTKFFGDWHQARVYMGASERFHLRDWERSLEDKLKALEGLYKMLVDDVNNRRMLYLELAIVILFIVDVVRLFYR